MNKPETTSSVSLNQPRKEIARVMGKAISACGVGREEIAKKMSGILGRNISKNMLDAYSSEAHDTHTPALDVAIAFDLATGQAALSGYFVSKFGGQIVLGKDIPLLEVARIQHEKALLGQREKRAMLAAGIVCREALEADVRIEMLEADVSAYQLMLAWLMANQPGDGALDFLRMQAFELEESVQGGKQDGKQELVVNALDRVRELAIWLEKDHKIWFSATELSLLGSKGVAELPKTLQGCRWRAINEGWVSREVKGGGGPGGMRTEYQPPAAVRALIHPFLEANPEFFKPKRGKVADTPKAPASSPGAFAEGYAAIARSRSTT